MRVGWVVGVLLLPGEGEQQQERAALWVFFLEAVSCVSFATLVEQGQVPQ